MMNNITHGDCMNMMHFIPDKSVDCVLTDVCYKQDFHDRGFNKKRPSHKKISEYGSNRNLEYDDFLDLCFSKLRQINFFTFCNKETKYDMITYAKKNGYKWNELSFCKTAPRPTTNVHWLPDTEYGVHIFKSLEVMGEYRTKRSWSIMRNFKEKDIEHPTAKSVDEVKRILINITKPNQIVLDPFSGSGTTAVACHSVKRQFIAIEKDEKYWRDSVKRLENEKQQVSLFSETDF